MTQVPGIGLDQAQLADVINKQYKGYSQKQRNQMMQSAAATPDNWSAITQQVNQTATQPSEFLGAGRTNNIPTVSQDNQQLTGYTAANLSDLYNTNNTYQNTPFDYTDSTGKGYFNNNTKQEVEASNPNSMSGSFKESTMPFRKAEAGKYYFADKFGIAHTLDKVGNNNYFVSGDTLNEHTRTGTADTWFSLDPKKDLSGLSYGTYNGKEGLFFNPTQTDLANLLVQGVNSSAYADHGGGGFLGGLNDFAESIAKWTDPVFYKSMGGGTDKSLWKDLTNEGLYSAVFNKLDPILDKIDPGHDWAQSKITSAIGADSQKEAFNQIAPIVLAAVTYGVGGGASAGTAAAGEGAATGAATTAGSTAAASSGSMANTILNGVQALNSINSGDALGAITSGLGAANINPLSKLTSSLQGYGLTPTQARMLGNFGLSSLTNLARGQNLKQSLAGSLFSTASGEAGAKLGDMLTPQLGEIAARATGGAASGGLNSLFTGNSPVNGSLFGAMSGGLHGFLNSTDKSNNTFNQQQDSRNKQQAQSVARLAKLFTRK